MPASLPQLDGLLLDLDGVLFRGAQPIPGASQLLNHLQDTGRPFCILTNNSTRTPEEYVDKLAGLGAALSPQQILTSAQVAAAHLASTRSPSQKVLVVGSDSLRSLLHARHVSMTIDWEEATDVLVGLDRNLSYETMARASLAIGHGAQFHGTNADRSFPSERGLEPGAGALLALLEATTGQRPVVYGKPQPAMFEEALRVLGTTAARTAMVGDRHETDIVGAVQAGLVPIGVTSGATTKEAFARLQPATPWVFPSVQELWQALRHQEG